MKSLYVISTGTIFDLESLITKQSPEQTLNKDFSGQPVELFSAILSLALNSTKLNRNWSCSSKHDGYKTTVFLSSTIKLHLVTVTKKIDEVFHYHTLLSLKSIGLLLCSSTRLCCISFCF